MLQATEVRSSRRVRPLRTSISGLGGRSYTVGIALGGVGGCLVDNLGGSLGSGIGVLDVVT